MKSRLTAPLLAVVWLATPHTAFATGLFVWGDDRMTVQEPTQIALISFADGHEDLVLSVDFRGALENFGWIVPLPRGVEIYAGDLLLFERLSKDTRERRFPRSERGARLDPVSEVAPIETFATETAPLLTTTVLDPREGGSCQEWCAANGYRLPAGADSLLDRIGDDGAVFVAFTIGALDSTARASRDPVSGTISPIRFHFATDEPVLPLALQSLGAGASTLTLYVLARDALAPRDDGDAWDTTIYARPENLTWISFFEAASATEPFLPNASAGLVLTRHRRRFEPDAMHDVRFEPYDAMREATSNEETDRLQAYAFLAAFPTPETAAFLVERLPQAVSSREAYAILWTLGEVGGPVAQRALLAHVDDEPAIRLECVESLAKIRSKAALPHFVRGLTTVASHAEDTMGPELQRACFAPVVEYGDSTCLAPLREIAVEHGGFDAWDPAAAHEPIDARDAGTLAVAALAACGDEAARATLVDAIVAGSDVTAAPESNETRRASIAGLSWLGPAALRGLPARDRHWPRLAWTLDAFAPSPTVRDALLRRAIADPHTPSSAIILLTSELAAPTDTDFVRLAQIAESAASNVTGSRDVGAVAYAFARHGRIDELLRLHETSRDDVDLEGEIACALAETADPRAYEPVLDYVRRVWNRTASDATFMVDGRDVTLQNATFDLPHRMRSIAKLPFQDAEDGVAAVHEAILDANLAPYVRLWFIRRIDFFAEGWESLLPDARRVAREMRSHTTDDKLAFFLDDADAYLERVAEALKTPRAERERRALRSLK